MKLDNFTGGWLVGNFIPSLIKTDAIEVGIKEISAGTTGDGHYHKLITEYTIILHGHAILNNQEYFKGDIIILKPNEKNYTKFIKDTLILSIKSMSIPDDKYY